MIISPVTFLAIVPVQIQGSLRALSRLNSIQMFGVVLLWLQNLHVVRVDNCVMGEPAYRIDRFRRCRDGVSLTVSNPFEIA